MAILCCACPAQAPAPAVVQPQVGERYRFSPALEGLEQRYEVLEVSASEVRYRVLNEFDRRELEPAVELVFHRRPGSRLPAGEDAVFELGERRLPCRISEADGLKTWTARAGDRVAFPGVLRLERAGVVTAELVAIDAPPPQGVEGS